ncbi:hypothetical protein CWS43_16385 [Rahnella sp. AA]|nr:hypothetical protein CWS43_16385 [Rahnella sp. AA]
MHHANESAKKFRLVLTFKTVAMKISPSHHLTISPSHHLTISPSHHLIISPSHHLMIPVSRDLYILGFLKYVMPILYFMITGLNDSGMPDITKSLSFWIWVAGLWD